jgi:hypothetical protein
MARRAVGRLKGKMRDKTNQNQQPSPPKKPQEPIVETPSAPKPESLLVPSVPESNQPTKTDTGSLDPDETGRMLFVSFTDAFSASRGDRISEVVLNDDELGKIASLELGEGKKSFRFFTAINQPEDISFWMEGTDIRHEMATTSIDPKTDLVVISALFEEDTSQVYDIAKPTRSFSFSHEADVVFFCSGSSGFVQDDDNYRSFTITDDTKSGKFNFPDAEVTIIAKKTSDGLRAYFAIEPIISTDDSVVQAIPEPEDLSGQDAAPSDAGKTLVLGSGHLSGPEDGSSEKEERNRRPTNPETPLPKGIVDSGLPEWPSSENPEAGQSAPSVDIDFEESGSDEAESEPAQVSTPETPKTGQGGPEEADEAQVGEKSTKLFPLSLPYHVLEVINSEDTVSKYFNELESEFELGGVGMERIDGKIKLLKPDSSFAAWVFLGNNEFGNQEYSDPVEVDHTDGGKASVVLTSKNGHTVVSVKKPKPESESVEEDQDESQEEGGSEGKKKQARPTLSERLSNGFSAIKERAKDSWQKEIPQDATQIAIGLGAGGAVIGYGLTLVQGFGIAGVIAGGALIAGGSIYDVVRRRRSD